MVMKSCDHDNDWPHSVFHTNDGRNNTCTAGKHRYVQRVQPRMPKAGSLNDYPECQMPECRIQVTKMLSWVRVKGRQCWELERWIDTVWDSYVLIRGRRPREATYAQIQIILYRSYKCFTVFFGKKIIVSFSPDIFPFLKCIGLCRHRTCSCSDELPTVCLVSGILLLRIFLSDGRV